MDLRKIVLVLAFLNLLSFHSTGFANQHGFSVMTNLGFHSTTQAISSGKGTSGDSLSGFAFDLGADYRFDSGFAVGGYYFRSSYDTPSGATEAPVFSGIMLAPRYYLPVGPIVFLGEVGLGWSWFTFESDSQIGSFGFEASGPALSGGLGLSYPILSFLSIGAFTRLTLPLFTEICIKVGSEEECGKPSSDMKDVFYGLSLALNISRMTNGGGGSSKDGLVQPSRNLPSEKRKKKSSRRLTQPVAP